MADEKTDDDLLSDDERARLRAEVRYAMVAAHEAAKPVPKSAAERILGILSNGFVLLLVGSIITSVLVPVIQKRGEQRAQRVAQMRECLSQFLLYTNTLWQEHYAVLPLTQVREIDKETYLGYVAKIAEIKLKRYDAYERLQALSVAFPKQDASGDTTIGAALRQYQIEMNSASAAIDKWLTSLYCTPFKRDASPCERFDLDFDAYAEHERIKETVIKVGNVTKEQLARRIVTEINEN